MARMTFIGVAAINARMHTAAQAALHEAAEDLVGKAQDVTPVDTGTLRASIHVESVQASATKGEATVATGGESSEYAVFVHEGTSRGVPAFKYIERPLIENAGVYRETMKRAVDGAF